MKQPASLELKLKILNQYDTEKKTFRELEKEHGYSFQTIHGWYSKRAKGELKGDTPKEKALPKKVKAVSTTSISEKPVPTNMFLRWTKEQIAILKRMLNEGKTAEEIGLVVGKTPATVGWKKSQLKLGTRLQMDTKSPNFVAFHRGEKLNIIRQKPVAKKSKKNTVIIDHSPGLDIQKNKNQISLGQHLDNMLASAKKNGVKVKVELYS